MTGLKYSRWLPSWRTWLRLSFTALVVLVFYGVYLDGQLTQRFGYARYQAPALLYSQALVIESQRPLSQQRIVQELKALDYQVGRYARHSGEYQLQDQQLLLHRRAFDFPTHYAPAERFRLLFNSAGYLTRIEAWPSQKELTQVQLEPQFLGRFSSDTGEDRLLIGLEQIPVLMREALILIEDKDFYHHKGVRPTAIMRAALANFMAGRTVQGGSTLTQQLIKNMYLSHEQTYVRKANEAIMALILDKRFAKDEILEAYFNEVYFGQDRGHAIHGVALASQFYFGQFVEDLTVAEIATLVGMIKGPAIYEPRRYPERSQQRRDFVLKRLFEHDLISQTQYLAALESPVRTRSETRLARFNRPDFIDLVQTEMRRLMPDSSWQKTGLRVFTTFDPEQQLLLEQAARSSVAAKQLGELERALLLTEPSTGAVRALIGGRAPVVGGFNRAITAQRPIGSLVKPWIYAMALEQSDRYTLATLLDDSPLRLKNQAGEIWSPNNVDRKFRGPVTLYQSLVHSYNLPVIRLGLELTAERVRTRLKASGIKSEVHAWPSLFLGAIDMNLMDVATLYGALANQGVSEQPYVISAMTTHRGELLYQHEQDSRAVFSPEAAWLTNFALAAAVQTGTAKALAHLGTGLSGKTGSTNDLRDSWFVSYDAEHVLTVWVGQDNNEPIGLTGSRGALPLAGAYWQQAGVALAREAPEAIAWAQVQPTNGVILAERYTGENAKPCAGSLYLPFIGSITSERYNCAGELFATDKTVSEQETSQEGQPQTPDATKKPWWRRVFGGE